MDLVKLGSFGSSSHVMMETSDRYIDAENDIYPVPLMSRSPSRKVIGFDKLIYAIYYLQVHRFRELLIELKDCTKRLEPNKPCTREFNLFGRDGYGQNLLSLVTNPNHPSNLSYPDNVDRYEGLFFTLLNTVSKHQLAMLIEDANDSMVGSVVSHLKDRPHWLIALWNYGMNFSDEDMKDYKYQPLKFRLPKFSSQGEPGKRYLNLMKEKCPITMTAINRPAMLVDGVIYDYLAITRHLLRKDTNPTTNDKLIIESGSIIRKVGDKYVGIPVSAKILYLPEENRFLHMDPVDDMEDE